MRDRGAIDDVPLWWSAAGEPAPGESVSGDAHVALPVAGGALLAVVDGLGHGPEAAAAAEAAVAVLRRHAGAAPVELVERCHEALVRTRGVALTIVAVDARACTLEWVGVGNVEARLLRAVPDVDDTAVLLRAGVVGYQLPPLRSSVVPLRQGDTLVVATDGITPAFGDRLDLERASADIAEEVIAEYARGIDDALVLVARYGEE